MHPELQEFFATHDANTRACVRSAKSQFAPILKVSNEIELFLTNLEQQLHLAEDASDEYPLQHNTQHLHQLIANTKAIAVKLRPIMRELSQSLNGLADGVDLQRVNMLAIVDQRRKELHAAAAAPDDPTVAV